MSSGNVYIGRLNKDAEYKVVEKLDNKPVLKISVFLGGKKPNGQYITVSLWGADADTFNGLRENDVIMFAGVPEEREYNGKVYRDMTPIWFRPMTGKPAPAPKKATAPPVDDMDNESLPF